MHYIENLGQQTGIFAFVILAIALGLYACVFVAVWCCRRLMQAVCMRPEAAAQAGVKRMIANGSTRSMKCSMACTLLFIMEKNDGLAVHTVYSSIPGSTSNEDEGKRMMWHCHGFQVLHASALHLPDSAVALPAMALLELPVTLWHLSITPQTRAEADRIQALP